VAFGHGPKIELFFEFSKFGVDVKTNSPGIVEPAETMPYSRHNSCAGGKNTCHLSGLPG
jgi:hypothetical protein